MFSGFGFKPPASGFQSYFEIRLLHPYSTDDKTSRLMVQRFSTVRDTQRSSQSYMEKRRGDQEEKRGSQKGRDQSSQQSVP